MGHMLGKSVKFNDYVFINLIVFSIVIILINFIYFSDTMTLYTVAYFNVY